MAHVVTNRIVHAATPTPAVPVESVAEIEQDAAPRIVSIPNVVIASVGQWATVQGDGTMTRDDLAAAVEAFNDPGFRAAPKGKPGHYDPRFDGQPGIGRFVNFRLSPDGMDLIADHVGLFEWQRTLVLAAWPSRSVEAFRGLTSTATWRTFGFVITAVALLGVEWPAVATLEDLQLWVTDEGPPEAQAAIAASVRHDRDDDLQNEEDEVAKPQTNGEPVKAAANIDQVRRDFIEWADEQSRYSWWIRELWLDPNFIIVDDDGGHLWRVPFTVTDNGVTFGDAVPVEVSYTDAAPDSGEAVAAAASRPSFAQVYANRSESRPANTNDQEGTMDTASIIAALGLPADTTDEQAQAALAAAQEAAQASLGGGEGDEGDGGEGAGGDEGEEEEAPAPQAVAASAAATGFTPPAGTVLVDEAQWGRVTQFMETVNAEREAEVKASRDKLVDDAVRTGRIAPDPEVKAAWRAALDKAPDEQARILASLAPTVPVAERGTSAAADADGDDSYPAGWSSKPQGVDMRRG